MSYGPRMGHRRNLGRAGHFRGTSARELPGPTLIMNLCSPGGGTMTDTEYGYKPALRIEDVEVHGPGPGPD
jgi:hypothetical protein